jgi:ABC-type multidrug transport system ATPase subunit
MTQSASMDSNLSTLAENRLGPLVSIADVRVHFGRLKAVNGISMELNQGDLLGLIGPNGSGKTTLLRAICGLPLGDPGRFADGRPLVGEHGEQLIWR